MEIDLDQPEAIAAAFVPQRTTRPGLEERQIRLIPNPAKAVPTPRPADKPPVRPESTYKPSVQKKQG